MLRLAALVSLAFAGLAASAPADVILDVKTARITLDSAGTVTSIRATDGTEYADPHGPKAFEIVTKDGVLRPTAVRRDGSALEVVFEGGGKAVFQVAEHPGFAVLELTQLSGVEDVIRFRPFSMKIGPTFTRATTLNAAYCGPFALCLMAAEPNIHAHSGQYCGIASDRDGCSHTFTQTKDDARSGTFASRFDATSTRDAANGHSVQGRRFDRPLDLTGFKALRAWVHGDGKGQFLKIQLYDGKKGYRDDYVKIDFTGWRQITFDHPGLNTLNYAHVDRITFYFNNLPAKQSVACGIDRVEALLDRDGKEESVLLEDFEDPSSCFWEAGRTSLCLDTYAEHGIRPVRFGILACPKPNFTRTIQGFEKAAGLPSPEPGGVWSKQSPWTKRSYFFLTRFRAEQFDEALAIAKRGRFDMILIGQGTWCKSTGHYPINTRNFPDGLPGLQRTIQRFKEAGFKVGLHFLGPSIYPPDPYLTPKPDPRLVRDAFTTLTADIDEKAKSIPADAMPHDFPIEDGGYRGKGSVIQIGDELIFYGTRSLEPPHQFIECRRGMYGTTIAPHKKGERIAHVRKSYGYFLYDMNTSLLDEVAAKFAAVANACDIDMIYFDGSERLQGGHEKHWYYNARFQKAFYDKLAKKDTFIQGSSYSHYSWHMHARSASADGHGDLKGYLDERSPGFLWRSNNLMPLDVGWYYGYDAKETLDEYEYILGATIAYDSSMSFQVSCDASASHPIGKETLDLIARYETLRLSGRVSDEMKERLRIDPALGGVKTPEERAALLSKRREYRLVAPEGKEAFQRVIYGTPHEIRARDPKQQEWAIEVTAPQVRAGIQLYANSNQRLVADTSYDSPQAVVMETFDDVSGYRPGALSGVTQTFESVAEDAKVGKRCALYTATSSLHSKNGWAVRSRDFDPPLDISSCKGLGFWLRGDGSGGFFKLQLTDHKRYWDNYVTINFTGWRYVQIPRPSTDPIDFAAVKRMSLYYNQIPAQGTVRCAVDDIKALPKLDKPSVLNPRVTIGGKTVRWHGPLAAGQWLTTWPGEPIQFSANAKQSAAASPDIPLPPGTHRVTADWDGPLAIPFTVRINQQPPERHAVNE